MFRQNINSKSTTVEMALAGSRLGIIAVGAVMLMLIVQMAEASQLPFVQQ